MSLEAIEDIALAYYEAINTPLSLSAAILLRYRETGQLITRSAEPNNYLDAHSYFRDACAASFLKKCADLPGISEEDRRVSAIQEWIRCEHQCFRANQYMNSVLDGQTPSTGMLDVITALRKNMKILIGRAPNNSHPRFGSGSTFDVRGERSLIPDKIAKVPDFTFNAWPFLRDWSHTAWARALRGDLFSLDQQSNGLPPLTLTPIRGNRWDSVPKKADRDRSIGIEPALNIFYQKSYGSAIRSRLRQKGLLLTNSQDIHRNLARKGSVDGSIATIDVKSASDTIYYALVRAVLPKDWFHLLDSLRSPFTGFSSAHKHVHGAFTYVWHRLEKFSSMGNGYTFELETALFASVCMACAEAANYPLVVGHNFSVYGDDIIVPTEIAPLVTRALKGLWFTLNEDKSFLTGPFRESCGGDFFSGVSVRPRSIEAIPSTPQDWIALHNKLMDDCLPFSTVEVRRLILDQIPSRLRCYGPVDFGDIVLHGQRHLYQTRRVLSRQTSRKIDGFHPIVLPEENVASRCLLKVVLPIVLPLHLEKWDERTNVASRLYGTGHQVHPKGDPDGYRTSWVSAFL